MLEPYHHRQRVENALFELWEYCSPLRLNRYSGLPYVLMLLFHTGVPPSMLTSSYDCYLGRSVPVDGREKRSTVFHASSTGVRDPAVTRFRHRSWFHLPTVSTL